METARTFGFAVMVGTIVYCVAVTAPWSVVAGALVYAHAYLSKPVIVVGRLDGTSGDTGTRSDSTHTDRN